MSFFSMPSARRCWTSSFEQRKVFAVLRLKWTAEIKRLRQWGLLAACLPFAAMAAGTLAGNKALTSSPNQPSNASIDYTISYQCSGTIAADKCYGAKVVDQLDPKVRIRTLPATPAGALYKICAGAAPDRATCTALGTAPNLPAGEKLTFFLSTAPHIADVLDNGSPSNLQIQVYQDPTLTVSGDSITNSVDYVWKPTPTDPEDKNSASSGPVTATATDKTTISKSVTLDGAAGYESRYQIQVCRHPSGAGNDTGWLEPTNITLTDTLPANANFRSASPAPSSNAGGVLTWSNLALAANQRCTNVSLSVDYPAGDLSQIKNNQASVTYTPKGESTPVTKSSNAPHTLQAPDPKFGGSKSQSDAIGNAGQPLSYTLSCRNNGNLLLNSCTVTDTVPDTLNVGNINSGGGQLEYWKTTGATACPAEIAPATNVGAYNGASSALTGIGTDRVCRIRVTWNSEILPTNTASATLAGTVCGADSTACASGATISSFPHNMVNTATFAAVSPQGPIGAQSHSTTFVVRSAAGNPTIAPRASKTASGTSIVPGNPIVFTLSMRNDHEYSSAPEQVDIVNPVFADLLPAELELNPLGLGAISATGTLPAGCNQDPAITITDNYNSTGRTLVKFDWTGTNCKMVRGEVPRQFTIATRVKQGTLPTATLRNRVTFLGSGTLGATSSENCSATPTADNPVTGAICQTTDAQSAGFAVARFASASSRKGVKGQLDSAFGYNNVDSIGRTVPGGAVAWQLEIVNDGNVAMDAIDIVDMLPFSPADGGTSGASRGVGTNVPAFAGSTWSPRFVDSLHPTMLLSPSNTPVTGDIYYTNAPNPCRSGAGTDPSIIKTLPGNSGFGACNPMTLLAPGVSLSNPANPPAAGVAGQWSTVLPANPGHVSAFRIKMNPANQTIPVGQSLRIEFLMQAPFDAPVVGGAGCTGGASQGAICTNVAWNSFGFQYKDTDGSVYNGAAPSSVGVMVQLPEAANASYGNYVWYDTNKDGVQNEPTENGINNVLVELWFDDGTGTLKLIGAQRTTNNPEVGPEQGRPGYYLFQDLPPTTGSQRYFTRFYAPDHVLGSNAASDWRATQPNAGGNDARDSDGVTTPGSHSTPGASDGAINMEKQGYVESNSVPLASGQHFRDADQGFFRIVPKLSLGNRVWLDTNNDGIDNDGAAGALGSGTGIAGVAVQLWKSDGSAMVQTTVTNATGHYLFTDLDVGEYRVVIPATSFAGGGPLNGYFSSGTTLDATNTPIDEGGKVGTTPEVGQVTASSRLEASDHGLKTTAVIGTIPVGSIVSTPIDLQPGTPTGEINSNDDTSKSAPRGKTQGRDDPAVDDHSDLTIDFGFFTPGVNPMQGTKSGAQLPGANVVRWTLTWHNDSIAPAEGVRITDEVPVGSTMHGDPTCTPSGGTVLKTCTYEPPSVAFPRGRVVAVADFGSSNPKNAAAHPLSVVFDVVVNDWKTAATLQNRGAAEWGAKGVPPTSTPTNPPVGPTGPTPGPYDPTGVTTPTPPKTPSTMLTPSPIPVDSPWALLALMLSLGWLARKHYARSRM
jgi:uncharacterized repeat protein (TIGR01451 family)